MLILSFFLYKENNQRANATLSNQSEQSVTRDVKKSNPKTLSSPLYPYTEREKLTPGDVLALNLETRTTRCYCLLDVFVKNENAICYESCPREQNSPHMTGYF